MRNRFSLVSVSGLALALAACSGPAQDADDTMEETATVEDVAQDAAEPANDEAAEAGAEAETGQDAGEEAGEDAAQDAPAPAATPSATPTPTPTPTRTAAPAPVVAAGPPAAFVTCGVCHATAPGQNGVGPSLAGVVGRKSGSAAGYSYSDAMQDANLTWNAANLERYLVDPNAVVAGTTMPAPGLNAAQAKAVVDYLKTL